MGYSTEENKQRMIELLIAAYPQGINTRLLADSLGVSQQTVRNYLVDLQDKEVPVIEVDSWVFTIDPRDYIRPLRLSLTQAWFLYLLVRRVVRADLNRFMLVNSLLARLVSSLHGEITDQIGLSMGIAKRTTWDEILETLVEGWHKHQLVRVQYFPLGSSTPTVMTVAPWSLEPAVWTDSNYLIAGIASKNGFRPLMLKLERIKSAQLLAQHFEAPDMSKLFQEIETSWGIWRSEHPVKVVLLFAYRVVDRVLETRWHPAQFLQPQDNGSLLWSAVVAEPREMMPWIRGWGADVEVIEPASLRADIAAEAERTLKLYGRPAGEDRNFF